ncbi:dual adapter for phosphotyrosine and 3-phosphotyrosine and 3-phosphoinositide-like isoform X2 [Sycon ciliatum]|uniref:dual adapter for phosphotyrosine and 3-phosphotyrosine and 3-phosphoinositide-like isoform X2 n=1 Tax=Sycon ciliatum TaxID=27933 RepID=UPI0020AC4FCF|eukprot:scpid70194/ scgid0414/ Dual adapter for phosphotyrosine and 3-phosphotyrosine and 3-phosphoinositide; B lymphocyte adapter protein Bam32; B-cell adapter molecule of 32 kDa
MKRGTLSLRRRDRLKRLRWFHPSLDRHTAEALLMANGCEGSYLLRPSVNHLGHFTLSIRTSDAVQHYDVRVEGETFHFGMGTFVSLKEFADHFDQMPVVGGESGILTQLMYPYPRDIVEPGMYESVRLHAEFAGQDAPGADEQAVRNSQLSIATKSGYMTKQGAIRKNWKTRWFTLRNNELKYFKKRGDEKPIRTIDLSSVEDIATDSSKGKRNCFRLVMESRTYYIYTSTENEMEDWIEMIRWRKRMSPGATLASA